MIQLVLDLFSTVQMGEWAFVPLTTPLPDGGFRMSCEHIGYSVLVDSPSGTPVCVGD